MNTNTQAQTQARFDSRSSSSISTGRVRKITPPVTVTSAEGKTIVYDKKPKK